MSVSSPRRNFAPIPEPFAGYEFEVLLRVLTQGIEAKMAAILLSDDRDVWVQACRGWEGDRKPDWQLLAPFLGLGRITIIDPDHRGPEEVVAGPMQPIMQFCVSVPFNHHAGGYYGWLLVADTRPLRASTELLATLEDGAVLVAGMADLIERLIEQRAAARRDPLTGLGNRAAFEQRLHRAAAGGGECAVLCLDLDRFKGVNDLHGHAVGDELLQQMAARIRRIAGGDGLAVRLGGDEFALLVEGKDAAGRAEAMAHEILALTKEPFRLSGGTLSQMVSIGLARCPGDSTDPVMLVRYADAALYRAKRSDRRRFRHFDPKEDTAFIERVDLDPELRRALAHGEMWIYWQKRIHAASGSLRRREALLRWIRPGYGVVLPEFFVPAAESSGMVAQLDRFALREACRQAAGWPEDSGTGPVSVAVNISPHWFRRGNLVAMVRDALAESGLDPRRLQLEVTESLLMSNPAPALRTMTRLKDMGVRLGLDHFGTAYSSLSYLARFPIDTIKLDRSFVSRICVEPRLLAIGRAVIQMAHALDMVICAEGIETKRQRDLLLREGVDEFQGFLFGRPVPVPD